jgi:cobalt-precorrin-5B (C1)-methyltransferase
MTETPVKEMRRGWTTGACAAAAARSAYTALFETEFPDPVAITLPGGQRPSFALARHALSDGVAEVAIVKDAGDDPDVTHGALVVVRLRLLNAGEGVRFRAGEGIGTVTREGLELDVGEPAINPAPRRMIVAEIMDVAAAHGVSPDVEVEIAIPGGEQLAKKTLNGRLGLSTVCLSWAQPESSFRFPAPLGYIRSTAPSMSRGRQG